MVWEITQNVKKELFALLALLSNNSKAWSRNRMYQPPTIASKMNWFPKKPSNTVMTGCLRASLEQLHPSWLMLSASEGIWVVGRNRTAGFPLSLSVRHDTVINDYTCHWANPNAADMQSLTFVDALMAKLKRVSQDDSTI